MSDQTSVSSKAATGRLSPATRNALVVVSCLLFIVTFDSGAVSVMLPSMARSVHADPQRMSMVRTSMLIAIAVVVPACGWLADRFGPRNVLRVAIGMFVVGSMLCGRAELLGTMVLARCLQGAGAALMVPLGRVLLTRIAPREELATAVAWQSPSAMAAMIVAPALAGWMATHGSWRTVFDIHLAFGLAAILLVTRYVEEVPRQDIPPLDGRGLVLAGTALAGLMFALETMGRDIVPRAVVIVALVAGLAAAVGYLWHERRVLAPVLDLRLIRLPCYGRVFRGAMFYRAGNGAVPFLLPMTLQLGAGWTPWESGLVFLASAMGGLPSAPCLGPLLRRFGFRVMIALLGVLSAAVFALCATLDARWPVFAVCALAMAWGLLAEMQTNTLIALAYDDVPRERLTAATGLTYAGGRLAQALGVALVAVAIDVGVSLYGDNGGNEAGFCAAFLLVGALALGSAPAAWRLPAGAGDELAGRRVSGRG